jgi:hypothetical protein
VLFIVEVWRTVSLMWTGTESVKGDRIVLCRELCGCFCNYDCGECGLNFEFRECGINYECGDCG